MLKVSRRKQMLKVARKLRMLSKKFPLMRVSMQSLKECMNVDVGSETVPIVDTSDIEKYYIETGEWGQTQQSQSRITSPMVSQYGSTPQATQSDEVLL
ncbi:hypothetical protein Hanom_Chr10g00897191 [Helianthus anomalus]